MIRRHCATLHGTVLMSLPIELGVRNYSSKLIHELDPPLSEKGIEVSELRETHAKCVKDKSDEKVGKGEQTFAWSAVHLAESIAAFGQPADRPYLDSITIYIIIQSVSKFSLSTHSAIVFTNHLSNGYSTTLSLHHLMFSSMKNATSFESALRVRARASLSVWTLLILYFKTPGIVI